MKKLTQEAFSYTDKASDMEQSCDKCYFFEADDSECEVFESVSKLELFDAEKKVKPKGWCAAWAPKKASLDGLRDKAGKMEEDE